MNKIYVVLLIAVFCLTTGVPCRAQSDEDYTAEYPERYGSDTDYEIDRMVEETEFAYGTVSAVNAKTSQITILERDWTKEEDVEVTYLIDEKTMVDGIDSWQNAKMGSEISIDYIMDDKKRRIARDIYIYEGDLDLEDIIE